MNKQILLLATLLMAAIVTNSSAAYAPESDSASSAVQAAGGFYFSAFGGVAIPDGEVSDFADVGYGPNIGLGLGTHVFQYRFEADVSYLTNFVHPLNDIWLSSTLIMLNAFYDFDFGSSFKPYLGLGLGVNHTSGEGLPSWMTVGDHLAYQVIAGASYQINPTLRIGGDYRFIYSRVYGSNQFNNVVSVVITHSFT